MRDLRRRPSPPTEELEIRQVPLATIRESDALRLRLPPYPGIDELVDSIRLRGQSTPLFVRPKGDGNYELISGYCRRAALEITGSATAIVRIYRDLDDQEAYDLAINENQGRTNLSDFERAKICLRLQKEGRTTKQIADRMGWNAESSVFRHLRIAKEAPPLLQEALQKRQVSMTLAATFLDHATELPVEVQREALAAAAEHEMSAPELQRYLRRAAGTEAPPKSKIPIRRLKDGGFVLAATRIDPRDPAEIDRVIEILETALKDARRLRKSVAKDDPTTHELIR